jgi:hypothetical protein
MSVLSTIHRYLGESLLLVAIVGMALAIVGLVRRQELERAETVFGSVYAGLLDLQALLGLAQFLWLLFAGANLLAGTFVLHPLLTVMAVVVVHVSRIWRDTSPPRRHWAQLAAYGLSLVLIFAGRMIVT